MELTREQKVIFYEEGYLKLEGVIPQAMIDAARQAINHEIGKGVRNGFPEINKTSVITDLFNETPAFPLLESALGKGNLQRLGAGAIKLNYTAPVGTPRKEPELASTVLSRGSGVRSATASTSSAGSLVGRVRSKRTGTCGSTT